MTDPFDRCPRALRAGSRPDAPRYHRVDGLFAVHGTPMAGLRLQVVARFEGDDIVVARGEPPGPSAPGERLAIGPVYALQPAGGPAVPTGRVLVRFADDVIARDREGVLRAAGYAIERTLPYAPQAATVTAIDADICSALLGMPHLESLPDVVHVEPEMLSEVGRRG